MNGALQERVTPVDVPHVPDLVVVAHRLQVLLQAVERARHALRVALDELVGVGRDVALRAAPVRDEHQLLFLQPPEHFVHLRARHARAAREFVAARGMPLHEREVELRLVLAESDLPQALQEAVHGSSLPK